MLLRCIAGLETPDWLYRPEWACYSTQKGINLPSRDRRIGFLFKTTPFSPECGSKHCLWSTTSAQTTTRSTGEQLARVQMQGLGNRYPHQVSGGQQQRVALARALAFNQKFSCSMNHFQPSIPTCSQMEKQLIETLSTYQGVSVFVTHNLEEAYRVCKNLLVLSEGKTGAYGSKENILSGLALSASLS